MHPELIKKILEENAYIRTGASPEELNCANYLMEKCVELGAENVHLEPFPMQMAKMKKAALYADGKEVPCKGYFNSGSGDWEAPLYYLANQDDWSLAQCRGKIVLSDLGLGYWTFRDLVANGALGYITYDGNSNYTDWDIDQKELRAHVACGDKLPGVNINVKTARQLLMDGVKKVRMVLEQEEYTGESRNVVAELPGQVDEWILLSAHYDSTPLSQGVYDNMSGCVGLLALMERFAKEEHCYGLRFLFCGSEERGLYGSKAYVKAHEAERNKIVLNVNLDMIGTAMGKFIACCSTEEKLVHYIEYLAMEAGFGMAARQDVYSSDSTPFADAGVPALSFARLDRNATIHNRYDTMAVMKPEQLALDADFIGLFVGRMANAAHCPVKREIPEPVKEKLDEYMNRKRKKN